MTCSNVQCYNNTDEREKPKAHTKSGAGADTALVAVAFRDVVRIFAIHTNDNSCANITLLKHC